MKRFLCLALALCLTACLLSGCGKKEKDKAESSSQVSSAAPTTAPTSPTPVKTAKAAKVKAEDGLNIRSAPSMDGEILGLAEEGSMLPLLVGTPDDGWYEVEYEGKSAYVSEDYVTVQDVTLEEYNRLKKNGSAVSSAPESAVSSSPAVSSKASSTTGSSSQPESSSGAAGGTEDGE